jgi:hypothetical protein
MWTPVLYLRPLLLPAWLQTHLEALIPECECVCV